MLLKNASKVLNMKFAVKLWKNFIKLNECLRAAFKRKSCFKQLTTKNVHRVFDNHSDSFLIISSFLYKTFCASSKVAREKNSFKRGHSICLCYLRHGDIKLNQ